MSELDTTRCYATPEGISLELRIAGPVVRACAWAIDAAIRLGCYLAISQAFDFFGGIGTAIISIGIFLVEWFYPVFFEVHSGATPGKKAMGLSVIHDNGTPVAWSSSIIRNLVRAADFFPLLYGTGLVAMLSNKDFKRLGDLAAGTLVVYQHSQKARKPLPPAQAKPLPYNLYIDDQQVLLDFAERIEQLSEERRIELAELLSELTGKKGRSSEQELYAYAQWLTKGS